MPLKIKPVSGHLYFDEVNADNMYQLNSLIEDTEKDKQYVKEKLKMLVAATPKDIFSKEDDEDSNDILFKLNREFDELWEMLESSSYDNAKLSIISELIDEYKYMSDENKLDPEKQSDFDRITLKESNKPNIVFVIENLDSIVFGAFLSKPVTDPDGNKDDSKALIFSFNPIRTYPIISGSQSYRYNDGVFFSIGFDDIHLVQFFLGRGSSKIGLPGCYGDKRLPNVSQYFTRYLDNRLYIKDIEVFSFDVE